MTNAKGCGGGTISVGMYLHLLLAGVLRQTRGCGVVAQDNCLGATNNHGIVRFSVLKI